MENPSDETQGVHRNVLEGMRMKDNYINAALRADEQLDGEPSYPVRIHADSRSEVWYKSDRKLGLPNGYAYIQYISPLSSASAKNAAMQDLFVGIVEKPLIGKLRALTNAEAIDYKVEIDNFGGLCVEVSGLINQKLPLLETITEWIAQCSNFVRQHLFQVNKEALLEYYKDLFMKPVSLTSVLSISLHLPGYWTVLDRYAAISKIDFLEFRSYLNNFIQLVYIKTFIHGNLTESDVIRSVQKCVQVLNSKVLPPDAFPSWTEALIPQGEYCLRVKSFDPYNHDSCTANYYQFDDPSLKTALMIDTFDKIVTAARSDAAHPKTIKKFDWMRHNDWVFHLVPTGYFIVAQSDHDSTVADLDSKIEDFREFLNEEFRNFTDDDLRGMKEYAITERVKKLRVAGSKEEVSANWAEIVTEEYIFSRQAQALDILREIRIEEFRAWMVNFTMAKSDNRFRKLTIQVVGCDEAWEGSRDGISSLEIIDRNCSFIHKRSHPLKYLTHLMYEKPRRSSSYFITDIESYLLRVKPFPNYGSDIEHRQITGYQ